MPGKMDAVGFIIRSMAERDPSKRRVKPSQQALEDFDGVALEDSSDDSDYKLEERSDDDDDDVDDEEEESSSSDEEDDSDEEDSTANRPVPLSAEGEEGGVSRAVCLPVCSAADASSDDTPKICCVCLSDASCDQNEVVECDNCHITVHEDCFGACDLPDAISSEELSPVKGAGGAAAAGLELWFCDACRAGLDPAEPLTATCELCPCEGGLLKRTDTGRWVHLVCALYVPGVAFLDVERLQGVTLFELGYGRWGGKQCQLCESPLLARTGVTVQCDAGMCKVAFHATCAQRHGLLEEVRQPDSPGGAVTGAGATVADPYFAHCRAHADRATVRARKRNYLAMQHRLRRLRAQGQAQPPSAHRQAVLRRLARARAAFSQSCSVGDTCWRPTMKLSRAIASSVVLGRILARRAELLAGDGTERPPPPQEGDSAGVAGSGARQWLLPPAFSADFVAYFCERRGRLEAGLRRAQQLEAERAALEARQACLSASCLELRQRLDAARQMAALLCADVSSIYSTLSQLSGQHMPLPAIAVTQQQQGEQGGQQQQGEWAVCVECGLSADESRCAVCGTCGHCYHLQCLEPPLLRVPRASRTSVWQCWRCVGPPLSPAGSLLNISGPGDDATATSVTGKRVRAPPKPFQLDSPPLQRRRRRRRNDVTSRPLPVSPPAAAAAATPTVGASVCSGDDLLLTPVSAAAPQQSNSQSANNSGASSGSTSTGPAADGEPSRRVRVPRRLHSPPPFPVRRAQNKRRVGASRSERSRDASEDLAAPWPPSDLPSHQSVGASGASSDSECAPATAAPCGAASQWRQRKRPRSGARRCRRGRPRLAPDADRQWFPTCQRPAQSNRRRRNPVSPALHLELQQQHPHQQQQQAWQSGAEEMEGEH